jgi:hypothetical protein
MQIRIRFRIPNTGLHQSLFKLSYFSLTICAVRREAASSAQLQAVATIVAHEISHQWYVHYLALLLSFRMRIPHRCAFGLALLDLDPGPVLAMKLAKMINNPIHVQNQKSVEDLRGYMN